MPDIKVCKKCGWIYPAAVPRGQCKYCGTHFREGTCIECGEYYTNYVGAEPKCRKCNIKATNKYYATHKETKDKAAKKYVKSKKNNADKKLEVWKSKLEEANKLCGPLSEDDWLKAVAHFNGCAYCGSDDVSTRGLFVSRKNNGRYNKCNIIPVCEKCSTWCYTCASGNPFKTLDYTINSVRLRNKDIHKLNTKIEAYLEKIIDEVLNGRVHIQY